MLILKEEGGGRYLGFPAVVGRSKRANFNFIKDRVLQKISSGSGRMLSMARIEVLIKSMVQSIPTYCMSIFQKPQSTGDEIQKTVNYFWWGKSTRGVKGIHLLKWDFMGLQSRLGIQKSVRFQFGHVREGGLEN